MLDLSYFQNNNSNVQGFFNGGTWHTWLKPRNAKLVNILCVGSGAGGGGGFQSATSPRAGGGPGGSGAISRLTIDANLLPDILYVLPGIGGSGGLGGTTATSGTSGQNSFVTLIPDTSSVSNVLLRSGTTRAIGGNPGTTAGGALGAGETVNVIANNIFANLGTFTFQAGNSGGGNGSATGGGGSGPNNFMVGAAGGGGTGGLGGGSTTVGSFPGYAGAPVNTNGASNLIFYKPTLILYGGGGGGGANTGNGGNGGDGAPGSGGGGGGASVNTGVNAGNGGRGGDGFIIITTTF